MLCKDNQNLSEKSDNLFSNFGASDKKEDKYAKAICVFGVQT
jgi:hypothetical protein